VIERSRYRFLLLLLLVASAVLLMHASEAFAQARNPFNVGISEGGGQSTGFVGWILAKQSEFDRLLSGAVRAVRTNGGALWTLVGLSFAYGVFHAAGPGHGKAVVASYMLANERALRRGLAISFAAALLQGIVAILIVGGLAMLLNATAQHMRQTAGMVEIASFAGVALLGAWLVWKKGRALLLELRTPEKLRQLDRPAAPSVASRFACDVCEPDAPHEHGPDCGHFHMPDPRRLGEGFSWKDAAMTTLAAGSRPCSGAILVLVFALAQGIFYAGVVATFAMALGTAITTGALAALAVLAKGLALRLTGTSGRGVIVARALEFISALAVLCLGLALLMGYAAAGL
jgi:nickel/cobalt exporter